MPPVINDKKCVRCGVCADICPLDVLYAEKIAGKVSHIQVRYPEECWHCRACEKECRAGAIRMRYPISHMMLYVTPEEGRSE